MMLRRDVTSLFIHLRDLIHPVRLLDGTADQTQDRQTAARRLDLRKDHKRQDRKHQRTCHRQRPIQIKYHSLHHHKHTEKLNHQPLRNRVRCKKLFQFQIAAPVILERLLYSSVASSDEVKGLDHTHSLYLL